MKKDEKKDKGKILIICTVIYTVIYLVWRIFFTIPIGYGMVSLIAAIVLLAVEIVGMFEAVVHFYNMSNIKKPKLPKISDDLYPDVDVFIATYNEPAKLLYKTINGCLNMDYPDKSKVHIYLCDDGHRDEIKELADHMKVGYITRTERKGSKAGNLNNAMSHTTSPLIATFDADMIPIHDFLMSTIPYFLTEEKVGFIQTPQCFYNPDLFQYNLFSEGRIPNEQDYFYRDVQVSKNKTNTVIYGGTNTVISREALNDAGGFFTDAITEDFATGIIIQSKGYKCYAVDDIHASGLSPQDLKSLIKQRERWGRGCIQTGRRVNILFRKGLSFKQKISYISSISYWYSGIKRLVYILSPILFSVFGIFVVKCTLPQVLVFWLPMYILTNRCLKSLSQNIRTTKWTNIYDTILFPSLIPPVLLETFGISQNKFAVTRKDGAGSSELKYSIKKAIPHMILGVLSLLGIINCFKLIFRWNTITYIVVLFWLIINLYNILMSIFFMLGRKPHRKFERASIQTKAVISYDENKIECETFDISEEGVAILVDKSEYIPESGSVNISIYTDRYSCGYEAEVVHVDEMNDKWKYALKLTKIEENNYRQLLGIIYDRVPALPKYIDKSNSIFDDIRLNILTRKDKKVIHNRKLPRLELNKKIQTKGFGQVEILNFNYKYVVIKTDYEYRDVYNITIPFSDDINVECVLKKHMANESKGKNKKAKESNKSIQLYSIRNSEEISENKELRMMLINMANEYKEVKKQMKVKAKKGQVSYELNEMSYL